MKRTVLSISAISVFLLLACSCRREDDTPSPDEDVLRMNVNGTLWQSPRERAAAFIDNRASTLLISGGDDDNNLVMKIASVTGTGTYQIRGSGSESGLSFGTRRGGRIEIFVIDPARRRSRGTLTITEITGSNSAQTYVKGTFSGVAYNVTGTDSLVITNGEFASFP
jgi:xanthine/CO dehydrogenase XdhC/CoxF family maturation factor